MASPIAQATRSWFRLGLVIALAACAGPPAEQAVALAEAPAAEPQAVEPANGARSYELRGQVIDPGAPGDEISIFHESIPDFANSSGEIVGMSSMTMSFLREPDATTEELNALDTIAFTLEVDWHAEPEARVTKIVKLPDTTELDLGGS